MDTALIHHYYDCFNKRQFQEAARLFADDADLQLMTGERARGGNGYLRFAESWVSAFPDASLSVLHIQPRTETMSEIYLQVSGTHRGTLDFGPYRFKASGNEAALHVRELLDVRGGKIVASVLTVDLTDLVTQLTRVDYDELARRLIKIRALADELGQAAGDATRQRLVANRLGVELDAARRVVRPHFNK